MIVLNFMDQSDLITVKFFRLIKFTYCWVMYIMIIATWNRDRSKFSLAYKMFNFVSSLNLGWPDFDKLVHYTWLMTLESTAITYHYYNLDLFSLHLTHYYLFANCLYYVWELSMSNFYIVMLNIIKRHKVII